jgi:uncharacterized protein YdeI (YjbR/CyaY-like superfamily)
MTDHKGLPILAFQSQADWDAWLAHQGARSGGIWVRFAKKSARALCVSKPEAIETALAHGWIDGQLDRFDDRFWLVRFTPRGPKSKRSQINRDTALRLIAQGRMKPSGLAEVERAKADGRWVAAYAPQSRAEAPEDLREALDAEPAASAFFATLGGANRYAVLYRIHDAKTAKTRAARIEKFVAMLARGETILLTGKYKRGEAPPEGTRLAVMGARAAAALNDRNFDRIEALAGWAEARGHSLLDLAFAWLLGHPEVASVIAGATRPEQVAANAATAGWKLTPDEVEEMTKLAA